jgi:hypothetical protein
LLNLEASINEIPLSSIDVPLSITTTDGGIDGRMSCLNVEIKWGSEPSYTNYLLSNNVGFQCKAKKMYPAECGEELLDNDALKPEIKALLESGGCYILFYNRSLTKRYITPRITEMRRALKQSGFLGYEDAKLDVYDANKIADWTNCYLQGIMYVHKLLGRNISSRLQTWDTWSEYPDVNDGYDYVTDQDIVKNLSLLRGRFKEHLLKKKAIVRIDGLSGLGKTRLAFEAFRPPLIAKEDPEQQEISDLVVYIKASREDDTTLVDMLCEWRDLKFSGILIVDDCDYKLHKALQREIENSKSDFSLLTLDYEPSDSFSTSGTQYIHLRQTSRGVIENIIKQRYPDLNDATISRIYDFAQGFPQMAVLLADAKLKGFDDLRKLTDSELVEKLMWGRTRFNQDAYDVISGCSIFKYFGIEGECANQLEYISTHICKLEYGDCYSHLIGFLNRGIIDKRGGLARVVPPPLAVQLAVDWWRRCPPNKVEEVIVSLPDDLRNQICQQMVAMGSEPKIIDIVGYLCGQKQSFGRAEVIMSNQGSDLFRYLTQVNPEATLSALERVFGTMDIETLRKGSSYRRNIVWSLENLCFWENTFLRAARLLSRFAEAENETWGNNATNQFLQLFHVYLSGTQASPQIRIFLIDEILQTASEAGKKIAIRALGSVLESNHFSRTAGVESQGSRYPASDWAPKKYYEIFDYYRAALTRLTLIACQRENTLAPMAGHEIATNVRSFVKYGLMDDLESSLVIIHEKNNIFWEEVLEEIRLAIDHLGDKIPHEGLVRLTQLERIFEPNDVRSKLLDVVVRPSIRYRRSKRRLDEVDLGESAAIKLGESLANDTVLLQHLPLLLTGEQRLSYEFGLAVGKKTKNPSNILDAATQIIKRTKQQDVNLSFLGGFLRGIRSDYGKLVYDYFVMAENDEQMWPFIVNLICLSEATESDLKLILRLMCASKISDESIRSLMYGRGLSKIDSKAVMSFLDNVPTKQNNTWMKFLLMYTYVDMEDGRVNMFKSILKRNLMSCDVSQIDHRFIEMDFYHFMEAFRALDPDGLDTEMMKHAIDSIIELTNSENIGPNQCHEMSEILEHYVLKNPVGAWELIGNHLLSNSGNRSLLMDFLSSDVFKKPQIISQISTEILEDWWNIHSQKGPLLIAEMIDPIERKDNMIVLSPVAGKLVRLGNEEILDALVMNQTGSAWVGKLSEQTEERMELLRVLKDQAPLKLTSSIERLQQYYAKKLENERNEEAEESIRFLP